MTRVRQGLDRLHLCSGSCWKDVQEKLLGLKHTDRTKTDTGRRDEKSKALGRTVVKELCKMIP